MVRPTFVCFESPTALFASQHNLFSTMWSDRAKGPLVTSQILVASQFRPCEDSFWGLNCAIAKRTKSKNKMQITEFRARLSQHKRVLREIQGRRSFCFTSVLGTPASSKSSTIPVRLSETGLSHDVTRALPNESPSVGRKRKIAQ